MRKQFTLLLLILFFHNSFSSPHKKAIGFGYKNVLSTNCILIPSLQYERFLSERTSIGISGGYAIYYRKTITGTIDFRWHFYDDEKYVDNDNDVDMYVGAFGKYSFQEAGSFISYIGGSDIQKIGAGLEYGVQNMQLNKFVWGATIGMGYSFLNYEYNNYVSSDKTDMPLMLRLSIYVGKAF